MPWNGAAASITDVIDLIHAFDTESDKQMNALNDAHERFPKIFKQDHEVAKLQFDSNS